MKRGELLLLFFTIFVGVVIFITTLFYTIKPSSNITLQTDKSNLKKQKNTDVKKSWIEKISKQSISFSYPVIIYKIN